MGTVRKNEGTIQSFFQERRDTLTVIRKRLLALVVVGLLCAPGSPAYTAPGGTPNPFELIPRDKDDFRYVQSTLADGAFRSEAGKLLVDGGYELTRYELAMITAKIADAASVQPLPENTKNAVGAAVNAFAPEMAVITGNPNIAKGYANLPKPKPVTAESEGASSGYVARASPEEETPPPAPQPVKAPPVEYKPVAKAAAPDPFSEVPADELLKRQTAAVGTEPSSVSGGKADVTPGASKAKQAVKQGRKFFVTGEHLLKYVRVKTSGNVPLDEEYNVDTYGKPAARLYEDQKQLKEELSVNFVWQMNEALRFTTSVIARNEDGMIWQKGKEVSFGNYMLTIKERTNIIWGHFDAAFTSYTLKQTNIKGVKVTHEGDDYMVTALGSYTQKKAEGQGTSPGQYDRLIKGLQFASRGLISGMDIAINYATSDDSGSLANPNGVFPESATVYGIAFGGKIGKMEVSGEYAHSKSNLDKTEPGWTFTGSAFFLDMASQISNKLSATLHLVNVGRTYDAHSLVEDRMGNYQYVDNKGDGTPDYQYKAGQRGFDLTANYIVKDGVSNLAFGYSNYPQTDEGTRMKDIWATINYSLNLMKGKGSMNISTGFEKRSVEDVDHRTWSTTVQTALDLFSGVLFNNTLQLTNDNVDGNETRTSTRLSKTITASKKLSIIPSVQYDTKKNSMAGKADVRNTLLALNAEYAMVPEQLTLTAQIAHNNYDVRQSEISESTGEKLDGEARKTTQYGLGLNYQPKSIPGFSAGVSLSSLKTKYTDATMPNGNATVLAATAAYSKAISKAANGSINVTYSRSKDKSNSQYDEVLLSATAAVNARIGEGNSINISFSRENHKKPLDPKANYSASQLLCDMRNSF